MLWIELWLISNLKFLLNFAVIHFILPKYGKVWIWSIKYEYSVNKHEVWRQCAFHTSYFNFILQNFILAPSPDANNFMPTIVCKQKYAKYMPCGTNIGRNERWVWPIMPTKITIVLIIIIIIMIKMCVACIATSPLYKYLTFVAFLQLNNIKNNERKFIVEFFLINQLTTMNHRKIQ